jgi:N-acetylmuramoyl-L-alanine amidase
VAAHAGTLYAAAVDFNHTLHPLLFPPRAPAGQVVRTIMLDPGHGGKDPGNKEGRRMEKEYTLLLAREVRDLLVKAGFKVLLTRNADTLVDLENRNSPGGRRPTFS